MNSALSDFVAWAEQRAPEIPSQPRTANKVRAGTGITQTLLDMIDAQQPISTTALCEQAGIGNKVVWGLLKNHLKSGRVHHDRSAGWTVRAPEGRSE